MLATQNPVDLDYKALSNAGTWFVGKLQTERDKARLIEGLLGVAAERGTLSDRGYLENVISALGNRIFLMHDVHRGNPILMQSRQALSYLRGPMTREQVATLMEPFKITRTREPGKKKKRPRSNRRSCEQTVPMATAVPMASLVPKCGRCQAELAPGMKFCPACGEPMQNAGATNPQDSGLKSESAPRGPSATPGGPSGPPPRRRYWPARSPSFTCPSPWPDRRRRARCSIKRSSTAPPRWCFSTRRRIRNTAEPTVC